jgi:hypothetical protein
LSYTTVLGASAGTCSGSSYEQYNVIIGYKTASAISGTQNTYVGARIGFGSSNSGYSNSALGNEALYNMNDSGSANVAVGYRALYDLTSGTANVAVGYQAGGGNTTGSSNIFIGYQAQADAGNYTNGIAIGNGAVLTASNRIVLGNTSISEIRAQVTSITAISDKRLKRDIAALPLGLDFIKALKPVQYRNDNGDEKLRFGFLAQDVAAILPTNLQELAEHDTDGLSLISRDRAGGRYYHMAYGELTAPLVKAVQEVDEKTKELGRQCLSPATVRKLVAAAVAKAVTEADHE